MSGGARPGRQFARVRRALFLGLAALVIILGIWSIPHTYDLRNKSNAYELAGTAAEELADEATNTILDVLRAGLAPESQWFDAYVRAGLDLLFEHMLVHRDVAAVVQRAISWPVIPRRKMAINRADICSSCTRPWV